MDSRVQREKEVRKVREAAPEAEEKRVFVKRLYDITLLKRY